MVEHAQGGEERQLENLRHFCAVLGMKEAPEVRSKLVRWVRALQIQETSSLVIMFGCFVSLSLGKLWSHACMHACMARMATS
jgi:hypothetical protein